MTAAETSKDHTDVKLYQQMIGSFMYLVTGTRPDLAYTVSRLAQYSAKPTQAHMAAAKRVLRYLKGTRDIELTYSRAEDKLSLNGYADADLANDKCYGAMYFDPMCYATTGISTLFLLWYTLSTPLQYPTVPKRTVPKRTVPLKTRWECH